MGYENKTHSHNLMSPGDIVGEYKLYFMWERGELLCFYGKTAVGCISKRWSC